MRIHYYLFVTTALLVPTRADTLTKRDGSSVNGIWLGYENEAVKFRVYDQVIEYARSAVSSIVFGASNIHQSYAQLPEPQTHVETAAAKQQPEFIGVVYLQDSTGALVSLEKTEAKFKYNALRTKYSLQVAGVKSTVRVKGGAKIFFVVHLANGVDPASMTLHVLAPTKDSRRVELDPDQKNAAYLTLPVNITKVGDSTYGISPARDLNPGEYAFSPQGVNTSYCFGVDAVASSKP